MPGMRNGIKRGALGGKEVAYIEGHKNQPIEQIAKYLRRSPSQIEKYLKEQAPEAPVQKLGLVSELENREEWRDIQDQFNEDELETFKHQYAEFMNQFGRDDVLPTEEMQIFQIITLRILAQQVMGERRLVSLKQKRLSRELEQLYENPDSDDEGYDMDVTAKEEAYKATQKSLDSITARYDSYTSKINSGLKTLTGERSSRVKVVESSKGSFLGLLRALTDEQFRGEVGQEVGVAQVAAAKEYDRLSAPTRYIDGTVDQPLLTPENILDSYEGFDVDANMAGES